MAAGNKKIGYSYLNSAVELLKRYDGGLPFHHYVKKYFSQHKKYGSKDRREILALCYTCFRMGKAFSTFPLREKILLSLKYFPDKPGPLWQEILGENPLPQVAHLVVFPWKEALSVGIKVDEFEDSLAVQPDLFLRIRPGLEETVLQKLKAAALAFKLEGAIIRLSNSQKIEAVFNLNQEVVVQDQSSQGTAVFLEIVKKQTTGSKPLSIYDCCAGSGGKSILAWDVLQPARLAVSDNRPSIIANLNKRLQQAGITGFQSQVRDLTKPIQRQVTFDLVIADLPCTGSGTWARTPEQLYYFENKQIDKYAALQTAILQQVAPAVKPGGYLLYLTCSVFKKENEDQVAALLQQGFTLVEQRLIIGYDKKADTMFGALLKK